MGGAGLVDLARARMDDHLADARRHGLARFARRAATPLAAAAPRYWTVIVPCMPVGGVPLAP